MVGEHSSIQIRPIEPSDKEALTAGFARLSPKSRYRRFLSSSDELSEAQLRYLTEVDHVDHEALVAVEPGTGEGIGVARYVRLEDRPEAAELGVAVVDERQGQGVGSLLLQRLAAVARANGIERFTALILQENKPMLSLFHDLGDVTVEGHEGPTVKLVVELPERGLGNALRGLLRATARGELVAHPLRMARRLGPSE